MSIGADLLRFSDRKIIYWDFESQRINCMDDNLPFECSWIVTQKGNILETHSYYLGWPGYKMSKEAAFITKFQQHWVDNGEDPDFVLEAFEGYMMDEQFLLAGTNVLAFDCMLWQLWRRALGKKNDYSMLPRVIDTHLLASAYKMGWKPDRDNLLAWQYKLYNSPQKGIKTSLKVMAKELGIPFDESQLHSASYDLKINNQVGWKLINMMEI